MSYKKIPIDLSKVAISDYERKRFQAAVIKGVAHDPEASRYSTDRDHAEACGVHDDYWCDCGKAIEPTLAMLNAGYDATRSEDGTPQFGNFTLGHVSAIYYAMMHEYAISKSRYVDDAEDGA